MPLARGTRSYVWCQRESGRFDHVPAMLAASEWTVRQPLKFPLDFGNVLAPEGDASREQRAFSVPVHGRLRLDINLRELLDESRNLFEQSNARRSSSS